MRARGPGGAGLNIRQFEDIRQDAWLRLDVSEEEETGVG
jgi:hypothetical protein